MLTTGMVLASLAGCGKAPAEETPAADTSVEAEEPADSEEAADSAEAEEPAIDTSERVDLIFYLVGDEPGDMQKVEDKVNEILLEKINATITFNFTTWTDYMTKYNMVLSSGEACDLIYSSSWTQYNPLQQAGAFMPLDDLLATYAPKLLEQIPIEKWNAAKVDGEIFAVPHWYEEYQSRCVAYRADLCEKYDLPIPNTMANMYEYLKGIKENDPQQNLLAAGASTSSYTHAFGIANYFAIEEPWGSFSPMYGLAFDYNNASEIYDYWGSDEFREHMKIMKQWADEGFWSKSVLSDTSTAGTISEGGIVIYFCNPNQYITQKNACKEAHPDWELGVVTASEMTGIAYPYTAMGNGTSIPVNSKNPERAAMALELLMLDEELNKLIMYGIEGEHYEVDDNGYYVPGPANDIYGYEGAGTWNLRNPNYMLNREADAEKVEMFAKQAEIAGTTNTPYVDIYSGFIEDYSSYSIERAAFLNVIVEYLTPIQAGLVDDVDAAIDEFLEKADEAGRGKIIESYIAQWKAYCEENGF